MCVYTDASSGACEPMQVCSNHNSMSTLSTLSTLPFKTVPGSEVPFGTCQLLICLVAGRYVTDLTRFPSEFILNFCNQILATEFVASACPSSSSSDSLGSSMSFLSFSLQRNVWAGNCAWHWHHQSRTERF